MNTILMSFTYLLSRSIIDIRLIAAAKCCSKLRTFRSEPLVLFVEVIQFGEMLFGEFLKG